MNHLLLTDDPDSPNVAPDDALRGALGQLDNVLIFGETKDGEEWIASSSSDLRQVLWLVERARVHVMKAFEAINPAEESD